jgi:hypothetical protein
MHHTLAFGSTMDKLDIVLIQDNRGSQAILRSMISSLRVGGSGSMTGPTTRSRT